jgi:hypothetical protein
MENRACGQPDSAKAKESAESSGFRCRFITNAEFRR